MWHARIDDYSDYIFIIRCFGKQGVTKGTCNYGIQYSKNQNDQTYDLIGYSDSDWSGDKYDRKSTTSYVFLYENVVVSWSSKKESVVALSSYEAEYIAASMAACQAQ